MRKFPLLAAVLLACCTSFGQNASLEKRLDSLTAAYERKGFNGVILVAKNDQVLFEKGYGFANLDQHIRNTPATLFKTESVGKMFTSVAILQLVESGKLRLDQNIKELLPELRIPNSEKITVHHLLTHTSGMQSPWDHPEWKFKKQYTRPELQHIVETVPMAFNEPGKQMFYSNSGYVVLGWIVEQLTGKTMEQHYQQAFFDKLNMRSTRELMDTVMPVQTGAQPYLIVDSKRHQLMSETVGPEASAAGGWISTARDLYRFVHALNSGRLLQPQTWELMRTANGTAPKDSSFRFYAYGLETYVNNLVAGSRLYGHNGGGAGFSIDAFVDPATGYIIASCTNMYQNSREIMANYLRAAMGQPLRPVQALPWVRVYDAIAAEGADTFFAKGKAGIEQLGLDVHPGMFAQVGDIMGQAGDQLLMAKWLEMGSAIFPEETFLIMLRGDNQLALGNKAAARELYTSVKTMAAKRNDQWLLGMVEGKLKTL